MMNIKRSVLAMSLWLLYYLQETSCFVDPITLSAGAALTLSLFGGGTYFFINSCKTQECCSSEKWIKKDMDALRMHMSRRFFGQHIAQSTVLSALTAHINNKQPQKALTMSFHGLPGSGKNYLSSIIANTYFKKGQNSKYYHFFNGRTEFPNDKQINNYKLSLKKKIINSLIDCPESIFVFDEVDMMPSGVLNILVPFLEYGQRQNIYGDDNQYIDIKSNKAIFIFLSNTGSREIVDTLVRLWENGENRDNTKLSDFENLITMGAFNEIGGFHKSDTIRTHLIDHYVPFLPMEEKHVKRCIEIEFNDQDYKPTNDDIDEVMAYVTFDSSTHNLFAKSGCKRLAPKVSTIIYKKKFDL